MKGMIGRLYTAYQVNDQGTGFFSTVTNTGEIWLSTVLHSPPAETRWLLSASTQMDPDVASLARSEPEPYTGTSKSGCFTPPYLMAPTSSTPPGSCAAPTPPSASGEARGSFPACVRGVEACICPLKICP
jgi:hypothetical protein